MFARTSSADSTAIISSGITLPAIDIPVDDRATKEALSLDALDEKNPESAAEFITTPDRQRLRLAHGFERLAGQQKRFGLPGCPGQRFAENDLAASDSRIE
jgi:hypothetical protein